MADAPPSLMAEMEKLITGMVRQAQRKRQVQAADKSKGLKAKYEPPNILDQARAAESALKFMAMKAKLEPEIVVSEFEQQLREFHNEPDDARGGGTASG